MEETLENKTYTLKDAKVLKRMIHYIKPYGLAFALAILLDIIVNTAFTMDPLIFSYILDSLEQGKEARQVYFFILLDVAFWLVGSIGGYFVEMILKKIGQGVVKDMREDLFTHVLSLSLADLRKLKTGSYVTRITNDTQNISSLFSDIFPQAFRALLSLIIILVTTFVTTHFYGFIFLAYLPVVFLLSTLFQKKVRKYYRREKDAISEMNSFLSEAFQGVKVTKTYAREEKKQLEFNQKNEEIRSAFLKSQYNFAFFYPFMYLLQMSCVILILLFCLPNVTKNPALTGGISIGLFQMLYSYSGQFFQPIQTLTQLQNLLQQAISSAERILMVSEEETEVEKEKGTLDVPSFKGKVEFRHVYFAYVGEEYVLKDVSFVIEPGKTAAFVGATGAGKSTIISLISRIYEVNKGEILIDDVPIHNYTLDCLRRNIGVMLQDVFLFSGTIEENITLGDDSISKEEIQKASQEVGLDGFVKTLPDGYEQKVTEKGENFSAGQRQLISFARTLVYHPSMVLLDEATANIDTETENIIQSSLEKMRSIGTMVIVAHRLSTIKNADVIYVVKQGEIIEEGTHQELLKKKGNYYNLYQLQNRELALQKD